MVSSVDYSVYPFIQTPQWAMTKGSVGRDPESLESQAQLIEVRTSFYGLREMCVKPFFSLEEL